MPLPTKLEYLQHCTKIDPEPNRHCEKLEMNEHKGEDIKAENVWNISHFLLRLHSVCYIWWYMMHMAADCQATGKNLWKHHDRGEGKLEWKGKDIKWRKSIFTLLFAYHSSSDSQDGISPILFYSLTRAAPPHNMVSNCPCVCVLCVQCANVVCKLKNAVMWYMPLTTIWKHRKNLFFIRGFSDSLRRLIMTYPPACTSSLAINIRGVGIMAAWSWAKSLPPPPPPAWEYAERQSEW